MPKTLMPVFEIFTKRLARTAFSATRSSREWDRKSKPDSALQCPPPSCLPTPITSQIDGPTSNLRDLQPVQMEGPSRDRDTRTPVVNKQEELNRGLRHQGPKGSDLDFCVNLLDETGAVQQFGVRHPLYGSQ